MTKYLVLLALLSACKSLNQSELQCTGVCSASDGNVFVAKNYDWKPEEGRIYLNKRGVGKKSMLLVNLYGNAGDDKTGVIFAPRNVPEYWISDYASMSFVQFVRDFPVGGMNEKGLIIELLILNKEPERTATVRKKPAIGGFQWLQYQLDKSTNIEQVLSSTRQMNMEYHGPPVHYMVCQNDGNCVVIEFSNKTFSTTPSTPGKAFVVTNEPVEQSQKDYDELKKSGNPLPTYDRENTPKDSAKERYMIASSIMEMNQNIDRNFFFEKLFPEVRTNNAKQNSVWNIVYEPKKLLIHFRTMSKPQIKTISLEQYQGQFECATGDVMVLNMLADNIEFLPYDRSFEEKEFLAVLPYLELKALGETGFARTLLAYAASMGQCGIKDEVVEEFRKREEKRKAMERGEQE